MDDRLSSFESNMKRLLDHQDKIRRAAERIEDDPDNRKTYQGKNTLRRFKQLKNLPPAKEEKRFAPLDVRHIERHSTPTTTTGEVIIGRKVDDINPDECSDYDITTTRADKL